MTVRLRDVAAWPVDVYVATNQYGETEVFHFFHHAEEWIRDTSCSGEPVVWRIEGPSFWTDGVGRVAIERKRVR